jgi:hypothetical protein
MPLDAQPHPRLVFVTPKKAKPRFSAKKAGA